MRGKSDPAACKIRATANAWFGLLPGLASGDDPPMLEGSGEDDGRTEGSGEDGVRPLIDRLREAEEVRQASQRSTPQYHQAAEEIETTAREIFLQTEADERSAEREAAKRSQEATGDRKR